MSPRILAVGIATLDIVNLVREMPGEDDEVRALSQHRQRGGNATNSLVILSQLGWKSAWAGVLPNEPDSYIVEQDLGLHAVSVKDVKRLASGKLPTSYITLSEAQGTRSIVHVRDLPEYKAEWFRQLNLEEFDWLHFEGRAVEELEPMLEHARTTSTPVSLEVEKPREGIEKLFSGPDLLLFSKRYAKYRGFNSGGRFLAKIRDEAKEGAIIACAWGEEGAWCSDASGKVFSSPAVNLARVVDTIGAGDTFNAAMIDGVWRKLPTREMLDRACHVAGLKCSKQGFDIEDEIRTLQH